MKINCILFGIALATVSSFLLSGCAPKHYGTGSPYMRSKEVMFCQNGDSLMKCRNDEELCILGHDSISSGAASYIFTNCYPVRLEPEIPGGGYDKKTDEYFFKYFDED